MLKKLKTEMERSGLGYSVFNYDDVMRKLEPFKQLWVEKGKPHLNFMSMDIEKCYDSVNVVKLCQYLSKTSLIDEEYYFATILCLKMKNQSQYKASNKRGNISHLFRKKYVRVSIEG